MSTALRVLLAIALSTALPLDADARGSTKTASHDVRQFLEGDLDGLALDPLGHLVPAPVAVEPMPTESLYAWSLALDAEGRLVVGAGDDGRLYRTEGRAADGELVELADTIAFELLSLLVDGDDVLAGTSPDGVVYRIDDEGSVEIELDLPQQSVWSLARGSVDGSWVAGTGPGARLIRGGEGSEAGEVLHRFPATNLTALLRDDDGLWIGTQGPGLVLRIDGDDTSTPALRYEAPQDEIAALVADGEGGVFVLSTNVSGEESERGSRIARVPRTGAFETLWEGDEVLLSLARTEDGSFLAGEAQSGRILRFDPQGRMGLWAELDGGDPLDILTDGDATYVATGNLGAVYALTRGGDGTGTFTSPIVETPRAEHFGRLWVSGWGGDVRYRTRTGLRASPDDSWSDWSGWQDLGEAITSPPGTHLQYELELDGTTVSAVHLAWAERNLPPVVERLRVLPAGGDVGRGGPGGGPSTVVQRFDNGLQVEYSAGATPRRAEPEDVTWVRGVRTIVWDAEDPNDDALRYDVDIRRLPGGDWIQVVDGHPERILAWDSGSVVDGIYVARVTATDEHVHASGRGRSGSQTSAAIRVDNTAPRIDDLEADDDAVRVRVVDASSPLDEVDVRDADGDWRPLEPADGVLDAPLEEFTVARDRLVDGRLWIRAVDRAGNTVLHEERIED